jgi:iron complex transport system substrate-binding protein
MKIVSLLPSATEIVYALGLEDDLLGVTHECNWPVAAMTKRRLTHSTIPQGSSAAEIDAIVSSGTVTNVFDTDALRELQPDLVLTQDLCAVCAVPSGQVADALDVLGCTAAVVSLDPSTLTDVLAGIREVGDATGRADTAATLLAALHGRLAAVSDAIRDEARPRVFALEWADPPFNGGHWVPEMIRIAGGEPVLCADGGRSVRVTWDEIAASTPDAIVFMPCGYDLAAAAAEVETFIELAPPGIAIFAVHADALFSRPGPRLVDGVELLASLLHPDLVHADIPDAAVRVR